jgi:hypothetical protein
MQLQLHTVEMKVTATVNVTVTVKVTVTEEHKYLCIKVVFRKQHQWQVGIYVEGSRLLLSWV